MLSQGDDARFRGVGEDGPTHQPVERIPALRLVPGLNIWRPCDSQENCCGVAFGC